MTDTVYKHGVRVVIGHQCIQPIQVACHGCRAIRSKAYYLQIIHLKSRWTNSLTIPPTLTCQTRRACLAPLRAAANDVVGWSRSQPCCVDFHKLQISQGNLGQISVCSIGWSRRRNDITMAAVLVLRLLT